LGGKENSTPTKKNLSKTRQQPPATTTGTEDSLCRAVKRLATSESQGALPEGNGQQQAGAPEVRRRTSRGHQPQQQAEAEAAAAAAAEAAAEAPPPPPPAATATTDTAFDEEYEATNQLLRRMHFERMSRLQREEERERREEGR
jgi:hypothetical protein